MSGMVELAPIRQRNPWWSWRGGVAVGAVLVGALLFAGNGSSGPSESDAEDMCRQFVTDRLKSPATADFSNESAAVLHSDRFRVTGVVDSQNSFGATVRSQYSCGIRYDGDDRWTLTGLNLG